MSTVPVSLTPNLIGKVIVVQIFPIDKDKNEIRNDEVIKHVGRLASYVLAPKNISYRLDGAAVADKFPTDDYLVEFYQHVTD